MPNQTHSFLSANYPNRSEEQLRGATDYGLLSADPADTRLPRGRTSASAELGLVRAGASHVRPAIWGWFQNRVPNKSARGRHGAHAVAFCPSVSQNSKFRIRLFGSWNQADSSGIAIRFRIPIAQLILKYKLIVRASGNLLPVLVFVT